MIRRSVIILFVFAIGTGASGIAQAQAALFKPAVGARVPEAVVDGTVIRSRTVRMDVTELLRLQDGDDPVVFNLFDDVSLVGTVERVAYRTVTRTIVYGHIAGEERSSFTLVVENEVVVGNIRAGDAGWYQIRYLGDGAHVVHEVDSSQFPPCAVDHEHGIRSDGEEGNRPPHQPEGTRTDDDGSIIRVLVVYTTDARVLAGGTAAIQSLVDLAVAETNTAYENSAINPQIELAYTQEVFYNESGQPSTDLSRLRNPDDGFIDEVHELRDQYAADLVSLLVSDMSACGVAYLMLDLSTSFESSAFSVVMLSCATGYYSFGHELGHNMGSHHDRDNAGPALFDYSYGYREPGESWRTIMAYAPGTRIQHFSNPDVMYGGQPTGVPITQPDSAHNALSINNAAFTVANFRTLPYPVNDECPDALEVVDGTYTGSTELAVAGGSSSCGSSSTSPDVWYAYTAQAGGALAIDTCGSAFDTVLSVHTFCPGTSANELACNDDSCGQQSSVTVDAFPGQVYLIRVAGAQGAFGEYVLNIAGPVDLTPPVPDPMVFSVPPTAATTSSITMEAAMAEDAASGPVKYYFDFVNVQIPGGHDSGWHTSPNYTDTGLLTNCLYGYNVRARDSVIPTANETAPSATFSVATFIETPQSAPVVVTEDTTATLGTTESFTNLIWGQSGLYFDCLTSDGDGGINEWVQMTSATAMDLTPDTEYTFRFKARNQDAVETDWSPTQTRRTKAAVPSAPVLSNATCASMDVAIGDDINPSYTTYAIHCTSTSPTDANWEGLYADASGNPKGSAVYRTQAEWGVTTLLNMAELTAYGFEVIARNASGITTAPGPEASLTTESCGSTPTCDDGILNQGEDRIDCGGPCPPCSCLSDGACSNGQYCDGVETCDAWGECQPGTSVDCDDSIACTVDSCNETTDQCDNLPDDAFCDNGLFCDGAEWCDLASGCQPGTSMDCDDGIACTVDSCNETTDQCDNLPDDAFCDNGLFCDGTEWCDPAVGCQDDADPCGPEETCNEEQDVCESLPFCATLPDPAVCKGDVNGDGEVDPSDAGLVKFWYGDTDPASLCSYDVNCDGTIDTSDVGLVKFYYGMCGPDSEAPCWMGP
jgi:hypothetical protein